MSEVADLLEAAAGEIIRRGFHQRSLGSAFSDPENCEVCTFGAINAATSGSPWLPGDIAEEVGRTNMAAKKLVSKIVGDDVPYWNDTPGRTQDEVVGALLSAAIVAREKANAKKRELVNA